MFLRLVEGGELGRCEAPRRCYTWLLVRSKANFNSDVSPAFTHAQRPPRQRLSSNDLLALAGDECLRRVAATLTGALMRPDDFLARYGGEEFAIVLPRTNLTGELRVAERLRASGQELGIVHPASPEANHITISQGLASKIPLRGSQANGWIALADQALYEAKKSGRNRVSLSPTATSVALFDFAAKQSHNRTHGPNAPLCLPSKS